MKRIFVFLMMIILLLPLYGFTAQADLVETVLPDRWPGGNSGDVEVGDLRLTFEDNSKDQNTNNASLWGQIATKWESGRAYTTGNNLVIHDGYIFTCSSGHTAAAATEPGTGVSWATVWGLWGQFTAAIQAEIDANTAKRVVSGAVVGENIVLTLADATTITIPASDFFDDTDTNTDAQTISTLSIDGSNILSVGISNGNTATVDLSQLLGGGGSALVVQDEGVQLDATVNTINFSGGGITAVESTDHVITVTVAAGSAPIDTVNGQTGTVVLDADDIDDTSTTNKFVTQSEKDEIAANTLKTIPTNNNELTNGAGYITAQSDDQTASEVPIVDAGSLLVATNTEGALQELATKLTDGVDGEWGVSLKNNTSTFTPQAGYDSGYTVIGNVPNAYYSAANHPLQLALTDPLVLAGSYTPTGTWNWQTATVTWPTFNQSTTGNATTATTAGNLSGTPALPNGVTATTQSGSDNSTKLATTAYVDSAVSGAGGVSSIASGTVTINPTSITDETCATVITDTATGAATTDRIGWTFASDPTAVIGYDPSGDLVYLVAYPTANTVNFKVCNKSGSAIDPGTIDINWGVLR